MYNQSRQFRKRNAILSCLRATAEHPSAERVYELLQSEHPDISLATVYRNIGWFRSQGLVRSLGAVDGVERFDACTAPHAHFICTGCGTVTDMPQVDLPYAAGYAAAADTGIRIDGCQLTYTGLCSRCNTQAQAE